MAAGGHTKNYLNKKSLLFFFKQVEVDHFLEIFSKVNMSFIYKIVAYLVYKRSKEKGHKQS